MTEEELENLNKSWAKAWLFQRCICLNSLSKVNTERLPQLENLFDADTDIHTKESGKGRWHEYNCQTGGDVEEVMEVYRKAESSIGIMFCNGHRFAPGWAACFSKQKRSWGVEQHKKRQWNGVVSGPLRPISGLGTPVLFPLWGNLRTINTN